MSKISYCSIHEAWGIDQDNETLIDDNNSNNSNNSNNLNDLNDLNDLNNNKISEFESNSDEIKILENKIKLLESQYQKLLNQKNNNSNFEHFQNNNQKSNLLDLLILIFIGILVIYLIDNISSMKK
jgi:hypothetical protein